MTAPSLRVGIEEAEHEAQSAAHRAHLRIVRPEDDHEIRLLVETGDRVWGPRGTLAPNELRALVHAGDPVHLALDQGQPGHPPIGFAVGFLGWSPVLHVHSHQVGVVDGHRHLGVGYALKLAQRHTCLAWGVTDMRWTFDPLMLRNAAFNLRSLGARAAAFYPDFYGDMRDAINTGDASDRLEAVWDLTRPLPQRSSAAGSEPHRPQRRGAPGPVLVEDRDGRPRLTGAEPAPNAIIAVPADYDGIRRQDPDRGGQWRTAIRRVLQASYATGLRVGVVDEAGYRLVRDDEA
jgi:predicted GNAT superfamily acetyltransferase